MKEQSPRLDESHQAKLGRPSPQAHRKAKSVSPWLRWIAVAIVASAAGYAIWRAGGALPEVTVAPVKMGDLWSSFSAEGVVQGTEYVLSCEGAGRVSAVGVREGQEVHAGDVLVRLTAEQQKSAVAEADAAYRSSLDLVDQARREVSLIERRHRAGVDAAAARVRQAQLTHAELLRGARAEEIEQAIQRSARAASALDEADRSLKRAQTLYASGAIARADLDRAQAAFRAAEAGAKEADAALGQVRAGPTEEQIAVSNSAVAAAVAEQEVVESEAGQIEVARKALAVAEGRASQARAALQRVRAALAEQRILSPADGVVTRLHVEPGAVVVPGAPVLVVSTRRDLRVEAEIGSEDSAKVQPGMSVEITASAFPGRRFKAVVRSVMPAGELKPDAAIRTRIVRARIEILEHASLFFPGMEVDVEAKSLLGKSVTIPTDALLFTGEAPSVLLVRDGRTVERKIGIGTQNADTTEVLSGLVVGDEVVVDGKDAVQAGVEVRVVQR